MDIPQSPAERTQSNNHFPRFHFVEYCDLHLPIEQSSTSDSTPTLGCDVEYGAERGDGPGHGQCQCDCGIDVSAWKENKLRGSLILGAGLIKTYSLHFSSSLLLFVLGQLLPLPPPLLLPCRCSWVNLNLFLAVSPPHYDHNLGTANDRFNYII